MSKALPKVAAPPTPPPPAANRVHIRLLWRLLEFEGEGKIAVYGGLIIGLAFLGWLIFRH